MGNRPFQTWAPSPTLLLVLAAVRPSEDGLDGPGSPAVTLNVTNDERAGGDGWRQSACVRCGDDCRLNARSFARESSLCCSRSRSTSRLATALLSSTDL